VLSKCANPLCLVPFRYLHEGRIFNVEIKKGDYQGPSKIEHFWLCEYCAKVLKVVLENGVVHTRPLHLALTAGQKQEKSKQERNAA
jgi:hypothetical protein